MRWWQRSNPLVKRIVVYTAIIGDFDTLLEPLVQGSSIRYVCITDDEALESMGWEIVSVKRSAEHPRLQQRSYKIQSHRLFPDSTTSLYVDGNFELVANPLDLANEYLADTDLALFEHPERNGVYAELEACAALAKDDQSTLASVAARYRAAGMPDDGYLHAGGFILRRHTQSIVDFNEAWYEELRRSTFRDQPSLAYTLWKTGLVPTTIHKNIWKNDLFNYHAHKERR